MEQIGGEDAGQRTSLWQVIGASVIGTIMEWYDFFIFAAAAALVAPAGTVESSMTLASS